MDDNQDPSSNPSRSPASLKYAIGSARAVVEALIARNQNAAEEAALQTCRDCDLLIRLIRDLALLLQDPLNQQTVCSLPVEVARPKLCDERGLRWMGRRRASRTGDEPCSRIAKCLSVWIPPN
jgi:hypothetical protein